MSPRRAIAFKFEAERARRELRLSRFKWARIEPDARELMMGRAVHDPAPSSADRSEHKIVLVGGGIASLAAAAFLIRDGDVLGRNITILEELGKLGGSLDGAGPPRDGYVVRGGRMLESKYLCTYDLFSSIPTLDGSKTVTQEIFDWNETMKTSSKSRLFSGGHRLTPPSSASAKNTSWRSSAWRSSPK